ncbi:MAG TPA: Nramp family divalent metal transporter [Chloroflexota bacterium]|nr:Nramp family divalent metal transporter [Chloroflexota bacterium]
MKAAGPPPSLAPLDSQSLDGRLNIAAHAALDGQRRGLFAMLPFAGPAFVASVAYIDPGNFATNIQGGSQFGYRLLWAVVLANLTAMLLQALSAKLGIATGRNLAELCGTHFPPRVSYPMWIVSEIGAMATDLAEFLGAALGLNLLFHLDLRVAVVLTGLATYAMLGLQRHGVRRLEALIAVLVGVIAASYVIETVLARPNWGDVAYHSVVPYVGNGSVLSIVGIMGATVMPHVIYLHSALTQRRIVPRSEAEARRIFHLSIPEVVVALSLAGVVNMAMLYMAASTFYAHGLTKIADIPTAYHTLTPLLGQAAGTVFAVSLLASGLSSSAVGTMAGQVIMQGFVGFSIPLWARRVITMIPTVVIVFLGVDPTKSLFYSQVVLSLILPLPVLALLYFTSRRAIMGTLVNPRHTTYAAGACAVMILVLNVLLVAQSAHTITHGFIPGVPGLNN